VKQLTALGQQAVIQTIREFGTLDRDGEFASVVIY
jgi:hypothetical protein